MRAKGRALVGTMALLAGSLVGLQVPLQVVLAAQAPRPRAGVVHVESSVASGAGLIGSRGVLVTTVKFARQARLSGTGATAGRDFGAAVALSADGDTALIASDKATGVFVRSGTIWAKQGPGLGKAHGTAVALSADGDTALIGDSNYGGSDYGPSGEALFYARSGSTWTEEGSPIAPGDGQEFGAAVALSARGNTALVGEPEYLNAWGEFGGSGDAWVLARSGSVWAVQGERIVGCDCLALVPGSSNEIGAAVALSSAGNTALIGAPFMGDLGVGGAVVGEADVEHRSGPGAPWKGLWLRPDNATVDPSWSGGDQPDLGSSVALSADGNTALVGGDTDSAGNGAVWIFTRSAGTWDTRGTKLTVPGTRSFGISVALSADGTTALAGGVNAAGEDEAWVFVRSGTTWTEQTAKLVVGKAGADPVAVALSADGSTALVGNSGTVTVFTALGRA